jgi:hypothetical protein
LAVLIVLAPGITSGVPCRARRPGACAQSLPTAPPRAQVASRNIHVSGFVSRAAAQPSTMLSQADKAQKSVSESYPAEEIQIIRGSAGPVPATPQQLDTSSNTNDATERGESAAALQYELANSSVLTTIALRSVA